MDIVIHDYTRMKTAGFDGLSLASSHLAWKENLQLALLSAECFRAGTREMIRQRTDVRHRFHFSQPLIRGF